MEDNQIGFPREQSFIDSLNAFNYTLHDECEINTYEVGYKIYFCNRMQILQWRNRSHAT